MGLGSVLALEGYIFSVILINHLNWDFKNENINAVCCFKPQIFMLPFSTCQCFTAFSTAQKMRGEESGFPAAQDPEG